MRNREKVGGKKEMRVKVENNDRKEKERKYEVQKYVEQERSQ